MPIIDDFNEAYFELFWEAYHYKDDPNPVPCVGKKRSTAGIRVRNSRAYQKLHIIDTRLEQLRAECEEAFRDITEWRADYENVK